MSEADLSSVRVAYTADAVPAAAAWRGPARVWAAAFAPLTRVLFDTAALAAAWHGAVEARLALNAVLPRALERRELIEVAPALSWIVLLWVLVSLYRGSYGSRRCGRPRRSAAAALHEAAESTLVAGALIVVVTYFSRQAGADLSRSFTALFVPLSFVTMITGRYAALLAVSVFEHRMAVPERVAVAGWGRPAADLVERLRQAGGSVEVVGVIAPAERRSTAREASAPRLPLIGKLDQLGALINIHALDRVVLIEGHLGAEETEHCSRVLKRMGVTASRAVAAAGPDARIDVSERYGLQWIELRPVSLTRWEEFLKRGIDVAVSATLLVVLGPFLAAVALAVKLTSPGPVFYRASRVGKGGRHFQFLKFRSMHMDAAGRGGLGARNEHSGHLFKIRRDPRITPLGRLLRRSSVDELPQLINVLLGQMSLVGPRPLPAEDLDPDGQSRRFREWADERSRVLPGITGLWQVSGRSELPFEKMVELDLGYVRNRCPRLDLRILLETPPAVLTGRGTY